VFSVGCVPKWFLQKKFSLKFNQPIRTGADESRQIDEALEIDHSPLEAIFRRLVKI
jgi:hypothetical protein